MGDTCSRRALIVGCLRGGVGGRATPPSDVWGGGGSGPNVDMGLGRPEGETRRLTAGCAGRPDRRLVERRAAWSEDKSDGSGWTMGMGRAPDDRDATRGTGGGAFTVPERERERTRVGAGEDTG